MFNSIYLEQTVTGELSSDETQGQNSAKTSASGSSEDLEGESGDRVTNTTPSSNTSSEITPNPLVSTPSILIQPESTFSVITLQPEETLSSQCVLQQSTNAPSTISQQPVSTPTEKSSVSQATDHCITYCKEKNITDPVEILRCAQKFLVRGKPLNGFTGDPEELNESNFILINRHDVIGTAMEEIGALLVEDVRLTLEVSFYGENAQDAGGPRREFFRLCLQAIKPKYFDSGLKEHLSEDYKIVGLIMALSVLQNGKIPRFLTEDQLQEIFMAERSTSSCLANLTQGLNMLPVFYRKSSTNVSASLSTLCSSAIDKEKVSAHPKAQVFRRWQ